ncbi:hypothetical protein GCM10014719_11240 [Planomonospora parontospora subsp. antibiotica]|nr:hypothetical protein GCM10014719_11240 [Planomonospora parontospora subsp. antibiotica]GII14837.1 hypothetical protein Ppa05_15630 [Planomonospora parontospora subsp. antibiotica]
MPVNLGNHPDPSHVPRRHTAPTGYVTAARELFLRGSREYGFPGTGFPGPRIAGPRIAGVGPRVRVLRTVASRGPREGGKGFTAAAVRRNVVGAI